MSLVERVASIGSLPDESEDERVRRSTLVLSTVLVALIAPAWVITYLALGLPVAAAIPFAYTVVTLSALAVLARTKRYRVFRTSELALSLALPFLLQWSLGGFAGSSAVCVWALTAPLGALMFVGTRQAVPWFAAYAALIGVSVALEWVLDPAEMPEWVRIAFFGGNVLGTSLTAYLLLQYFVREREREHARSERLLLNVLPEPVALRLKRHEGVIADRFEEATVLFADIADFTPMSAGLPPEEVVELLNAVFSDFDRLAERHGLEKIKTIGDADMVAAGIPAPRPDHADAIARMALEMQETTSMSHPGVRLRIGIDSGPVVAGVIGRRKFIYDLWGDTVNTASRMESHGLPGEIQVTERVVAALAGRFRLEPRGLVEVKGKGSMQTWLLRGRVDAGSVNPV